MFLPQSHFPLCIYFELEQCDKKTVFTNVMVLLYDLHTYTYTHIHIPLRAFVFIRGEHANVAMFQLKLKVENL